MAPFIVHIKNAGKAYDVELDPDLPPKAFKEAIYQKTGIPPDRMKVMVKGGVLKEDTQWAKINPKPDQTFTVIGTAGELPKPPEQATVFLEDMDDAELAQALTKPVGLKNLGNTCYMNSTVQMLRAIPELQLALNSTTGGGGLGDLPRSMKDLYTSLGKTTDSVTPMTFLSVLRRVAPQFAELDSGGSSGMMRGYAQQDAEECYTQILNSLREVPLPQLPGANNVTGKFIERYMIAEVRRTLKNAETEEEPPTITHEKVMKVECNITKDTNYMATGISNTLRTNIEKRSQVLGREAQYVQTSEYTRLPAYLTVHMVRFAWKQDVGKKAKIMRKVKFPTEYDALDIVSPELKAKLLPAGRRLKEAEKERASRRKVRKRTKNAPQQATASTSEASSAPAAPLAEGELGPEEEYRAKERAEIEALVPDDIKADLGSTWTGLYELVAIITHKGAAADSGHYIGFAKKSVFHGFGNPNQLLATSSAPNPAASSSGGDVTMGDATSTAGSTPLNINPNLSQYVDGWDEDDEDWYKFDDDKVSIFPKEKLNSLDGGGEDSVAYVLLYRTKVL